MENSGIDKLNALVAQIRQNLEKPKKEKKATARKVSSSSEPVPRHWITQDRFISIRTQECLCCGSLNRYANGEFFLQKSGSITRTVRRGHVDITLEAFELPIHIWLHNKETTPVCPSCLGLNDVPLVDAMIESLDWQYNQQAQMSLPL